MPTVTTPATDLYSRLINKSVDEIASASLEPVHGHVRIHATKSDFTDGLGASGTFATGKKIPAGAYAVQTLLYVATAATGDTTCVISVGDGSDADRYNVATASIYTAGFVDMTTLGIPSGTKFHSAEKSITLTVTGGSDFTALAAFDIIVDVIYFRP